MKTLILLLGFFSLLSFASTSHAKVISGACYSCIASDGAKAAYKFSITDEKVNGAWGVATNREIHEVSGREKQLNSEISTYWVLPYSSGSVLNSLPGLTRPADNNERYVKNLILVNNTTSKAYACSIVGGDF